MPIFEYKCTQCGKEFEELVLSDKETPACPQCGAKKTEKLMSCCRFKSGGASPVGEAESASTTSSSSSSCAGCSGGSCATCH